MVFGGDLDLVGCPVISNDVIYGLPKLICSPRIENQFHFVQFPTTSSNHNQIFLTRPSKYLTRPFASPGDRVHLISSTMLNNAPLPTPTPEELDDLIYFSRTGDLESLKASITNLCSVHSCAPSNIIATAIDIDEEGLGSQSSLLHYPAANGNVEIVSYLLTLLAPSQSLQGSPSGTTADKSAPLLVNHRNVSGNTPLHWAGVNGHLEVVKLLVQAGADATIINAAGRDAVVESEVSAKEGAAECAVWLLKNCEGLEQGLGGEREDEGEDEDEVELVQDTGATNGSSDSTGKNPSTEASEQT